MVGWPRVQVVGMAASSDGPGWGVAASSDGLDWGGVAASSGGGMALDLAWIGV